MSSFGIGQTTFTESCRLSSSARSALSASLPSSDQFGVMTNGEWPPDEIARHFIAPFLSKERLLGFDLDTFCEDWNLEAMTQPDDRADNRPGVMVTFKVGN